MTDLFFLPSASLRTSKKMWKILVFVKIFPAFSQSKTIALVLFACDAEQSSFDCVCASNEYLENLYEFQLNTDKSRPYR